MAQVPYTMFKLYSSGYKPHRYRSCSQPFPLPARLTCCSIFSRQRHIQEFITINNPVILIPCSSKKSGRGRKFSSTSSLPILFILFYIDDFFLGRNHSPFVRDVRSDRIPKQAEGQVPPTPSLKRRSKLWDGSPPRKFTRF